MCFLRKCVSWTREVSRRCLHCATLAGRYARAKTWPLSFLRCTRTHIDNLRNCLQADARAKVWAMLRKFKDRGNLMGCASNGEEAEVARVAPQTRRARPRTATGTRAASCSQRPRSCTMPSTARAVKDHTSHALPPWHSHTLDACTSVITALTCVLL